MTRSRMLIFVTLLALGAAACGSSGDDTSSTAPTSASTTTAASTGAPTTAAATTAAPTIAATEWGVLEARDTAAAYFAAYNEGDADAVFALFMPDAEFDGGFFGPMSRARWEQLLVWNFAQGTVLGPHSCLLAEEVVDDFVRLVCSFGNSDAAVQAVGGTAVPIKLTLVFTPDGITKWDREIAGPPNFNEVGIPFIEWMTRNHPEVVPDVEFDNWSSIEGAERNGMLNAQYAAEWRVDLDAKGCDYDDDC